MKLMQVIAGIYFQWQERDETDAMQDEAEKNCSAAQNKMTQEKISGKG